MLVRDPRLILVYGDHSIRSSIRPGYAGRKAVPPLAGWLFRAPHELTSGGTLGVVARRGFRSRAALAIVCCAVAAAACSSAAADRSPESQPTLVVMAKWGAETTEGPSFLQVLRAFERETGIAVEYLGVGDQMPVVLSTRVAAGDPPDIAILPQPGLLRDLVERGALVPFADGAASMVRANFAPMWVDLGSAGGELYGVFFKASNKSTVWYTVAVFTENGISPPETWEEWLTSSQALLDAGITPLSVGAADGWILSDWFENIYLRTAGPDMYDKLAGREIPWTHPTVKEALRVMGELLGNDAYLVDGVSGSLRTDFVTSVKQVFTAEPAAAVVFEGDFVAGVIVGETALQAGRDFRFFEFPSIEGSPRSAIAGGDVVVVLRNTAGAMALIEYLAGSEAAEIWVQRGGFSSPNRSVDLAAYPDDVSRAAAEALTAADIVRFDLSDLVSACFGARTGAGVWGGLQDWLADPGAIDAVLKQLEADASC